MTARDHRSRLTPEAVPEALIYSLRHASFKKNSVEDLFVPDDSEPCRRSQPLVQTSNTGEYASNRLIPVTMILQCPKTLLSGVESILPLRDEKYKFRGFLIVPFSIRSI